MSFSISLSQLGTMKSDTDGTILARVVNELKHTPFSKRIIHAFRHAA